MKRFSSVKIGQKFRALKGSIFLKMADHKLYTSEGAELAFNCVHVISGQVKYFPDDELIAVIT